MLVLKSNNSRKIYKSKKYLYFMGKLINLMIATAVLTGLVGTVYGNERQLKERRMRRVTIESIVSEAKEDSLWKKIDKGLYVGEFVSPKKSSIGDSKIMVVKANPKYYSFKLLDHPDGKVLTAEEWAKKYNLIAVINAGMFLPSMKNVGYMKNFDHVDNPRINRKYNAFLAFNPKDSSLPEIQIIDKEYQDFDYLKDKYNTFIQNPRIMDIKQRGTWGKSKKKWSIASLAIDKDGNVLLIHSRSPYSVHEFTNILLSLPLNIYNAMYLEGGPEATLYLKKDSLELERVGSYETGFNENDLNNEEWSIPNVIGIIKKN